MIVEPTLRTLFAGHAAVAMLGARDVLERLDERISAWLDRTSDALHGRKPTPEHAKAWRASASRRLLQVARIASDLSLNTRTLQVERAAGRVYALLGQVEDCLDVIYREEYRASAMGRSR